MDKIVLIDADGLVYHSSKDELEFSINTLKEKIQNIFEKTEATHYVMFLSFGKYFRHEIYPEYKESRGRYQTQLKWVKTLKNYLLEAYGATYVPRVEADDLIAYWYRERKDNICIASPDKDILQSTPGKHFDYTYKLDDKDNPDSVIKGRWVETSEEDANEFKMYQLIVGDSADGIKGVGGRGKKYFDDNKPWSYEKVLKTYQDRYGISQGIFEFQKNFRLLHLLSSAEDFLREVGSGTSLMFAPQEIPCNISNEDSIELDMSDVNF